MTPSHISDISKLKDIKNFKLLGKVGQGILGTVYRALHI